MVACILLSYSRRLPGLDIDQYQRWSVRCLSHLANTGAIWLSMFLYTSGNKTVRPRDRDVFRGRMFLIFVFDLFWALFEQSPGSSLTYTIVSGERNILASKFPPRTFSVDKCDYIVLLLYFRAALTHARRRGSNLCTAKICLGLIQPWRMLSGLVARCAGCGTGNLTPFFSFSLITCWHTTGELPVSVLSAHESTLRLRAYGKA